MSTYYVTAVSFNSQGAINQLLVHLPSAPGGVLHKGIKMSEAQLIPILRTNGNRALTAQWSYTKAVWTEGQEIHIVHNGTRQYLRSTKDLTIADNLKNLLPLDQLH